VKTVMTIILATMGTNTFCSLRELYCKLPSQSQILPIERINKRDVSEDLYDLRGQSMKSEDRTGCTLSPYGQFVLPIVQQSGALSEFKSIQIDLISVFRNVARRKRFSRGVRGTEKVVPPGQVVAA